MVWVRALIAVTCGPPRGPPPVGPSSPVGAPPRGVTGQGEEHVVEGRAAQADVVDHDALGVELADDSARTARPPPSDRHGDLAGVVVDGRPAAAPGRRARARRRRCVAVSCDDDLDALAADLGLELVGGAPGDDLAVVDDDDVVGEAVGLLEVLRGEQHGRRRRRTRSRDHVPHAVRLRGSRPVVGSSRNSTGGPGDEGAGEVEPAAHAAGVGLDGAVRGLVEAGTGRAARGPGFRAAAGPVVEPADHLEVLAAGEVFVDGRELAREPDGARARPARRLSTSMPATSARPQSGCSRVVSTRTAVVLPAPFGPSRPRTVPSGTSRSSPSSARTSP